MLGDEFTRVPRRHEIVVDVPGDIAIGVHLTAAELYIQRLGFWVIPRGGYRGGVFDRLTNQGRSLPTVQNSSFSLVNFPLTCRDTYDPTLGVLMISVKMYCGTSRYL